MKFLTQNVSFANRGLAIKASRAKATICGCRDVARNHGKFCVHRLTPEGADKNPSHYSISKIFLEKVHSLLLLLTMLL